MENVFWNVNLQNRVFLCDKCYNNQNFLMWTVLGSWSVENMHLVNSMLWKMGWDILEYATFWLFYPRYTISNYLYNFRSLGGQSCCAYSFLIYFLCSHESVLLSLLIQVHLPTETICHPHLRTDGNWRITTCYSFCFECFVYHALKVLKGER